MLTTSLILYYLDIPPEINNYIKYYNIDICIKKIYSPHALVLNKTFIYVSLANFKHTHSLISANIVVFIYKIVSKSTD